MSFLGQPYEVVKENVIVLILIMEELGLKEKEGWPKVTQQVNRAGKMGTQICMFTHQKCVLCYLLTILLHPSPPARR